ncbi:MAG: CmcJ/NvfI family oxidoreductase [Alphaproteobacteria bacterium]
MESVSEGVEAALNYVVKTGEPIVIRPSVAGGAAGERNGRFEERTAVIHDARPMIGELSLDREGFALVSHRTAVTDFHDEEQRRTVYDPEIERLVGEATGAARVVVFDHTLRSDSEETRTRMKIREPVQGVHNDYTPRSGPQRVRDLFPADEAEDLLSRRFSIINVWRSTGGAIETMPLGICDARSIPPDDLVVSERRAVDRVGYTYRIAYNADHKWYWFPTMQFDEAMLIKSYDSATDGAARFTPHTAFPVPGTPPDAAPRQSIESRLFAFF